MFQYFVFVLEYMGDNVIICDLFHKQKGNVVNQTAISLTVPVAANDINKTENIHRYKRRQWVRKDKIFSQG